MPASVAVKLTFFCNQEVKVKETMRLRDGQGEHRLHQHALRQGGLACQIEYRQIPICTGHDDNLDPIVEVVDWPFILPKAFDSGPHYGHYLLQKN